MKQNKYFQSLHGTCFMLYVWNIKTVGTYLTKLRNKIVAVNQEIHSPQMNLICYAYTCIVHTVCYVHKLSYNGVCLACSEGRQFLDSLKLVVS